MNIRALKPTDLFILREIHKEFYKEEFVFPNFETGFACCFVVEDENHDVVSAGGLRPIAESIIITDRRQSVRKRREALYDILAASTYLGHKEGYEQIHAFIQEKGWESHLKKVGFQQTKGNSLVLNI